MSETMVERVARAIAEKHGFADIVEDRMYADLARAAIEAMREPTADMSASAREADAMWDADREKDPGIVWRIMIDAALSESP